MPLPLPRRWSRRQILAALGALGVSGCTHSPVLQLARQSFGLGDTSDAYPVTRAHVDDQPYAAIAARLGDHPWAVLVLSRHLGVELHWLGADRAVLVTRHGRLQQTVGLPRDLRRSMPRNEDPLASGLHGIPPDTVFHRVMDVAPDEFGLLVQSRYVQEEPEAITILDRTHQTLRIREDFRVVEWGWKGENRYWVDPDSGFVWRSRQAFAPDVPPLTLEILKPAT